MHQSLAVILEKGQTRTIKKDSILFVYMPGTFFCSTGKGSLLCRIIMIVLVIRNKLTLFQIFYCLYQLSFVPRIKTNLDISNKDI